MFDAVANPDAIKWYKLSALPAAHADAFRLLVELHHERTGSARAEALLANFERTCEETLLIVPDEIASRVLGEDGVKVAAE